MRKFINIVEGSHTPPQYERDDEDFYVARDETGFFGRQAAGCIAMAKTTGRILIVHRSAQVDQPHTWGNLGGAHDAGEQPVDAARRELHEETGYNGSVQMIPLLVFKSGTFKYCNFLAIVEDEFVPDLGWEADDHVWAEWGKWPSPLHFGLQSLFSDSASAKAIQHYASLFSK